MNDWTDLELQTLVNMKTSNKSIPYQEIADKIPNRTAEACRRKWNRIKVSPEMDSLSTYEDLYVQGLDIYGDMDLDTWIDSIENMRSLRKKASPSVTTAEVYIKTNGRPIAFSPISCMHIGGLYVNHKIIRNRLAQIFAIDRFFFGLHGDDIENFPADWAATVFNNVIPPYYQKLLLEKIVQKFADVGKLLYSVRGNHELFTERKIGEAATAEIFYKNGIPHFESRGILKLMVDDIQYVMSLAHQFPGKSLNNPNHAQGREFRDFPFADFVISGHTHEDAYQEYSCNSRAVKAGLTDTNRVRLIQVGTAKVDSDPYSVRYFDDNIWNFQTWPVFILSAKKHQTCKVEDFVSLQWYLNRQDY